jgi:hypothetical protein
MRERYVLLGLRNAAPMNYEDVDSSLPTLSFMITSFSLRVGTVSRKERTRRNMFVISEERAWLGNIEGSGCNGFIDIDREQHSYRDLGLQMRAHIFHRCI